MNIQEIEFVSSTKRVHRVSVFAKGASLGNCLSAENRILTNKSRNAFSALGCHQKWFNNNSKRVMPSRYPSLGLSISVKRTCVTFSGDARGAPHSYWLTHRLTHCGGCCHIVKEKGQAALQLCQCENKYSNTRCGPENTITHTVY